jgi:hypothetical protein
MDALALLKRYQDSDMDFYDPAETVPLAHVVPEDWKEAVVDPDTGLIERIPVRTMRACRAAQGDPSTRDLGRGWQHLA